jgi:hypothetical protein
MQLEKSYGKSKLMVCVNIAIRRYDMKPLCGVVVLTFSTLSIKGQ